MGRRNKRQRYTPPDRARQMEALEKPVRLDGVGEDPAVRELVAGEFIEMDSKQAMQLALALQQIIDGQDSIRLHQGDMAAKLDKLTERMDAFDRAAVAWQNDRAQMVEDVMNQADKLRLPDAQREQFQTRGAASYQQVLREAQVRRRQNLREFEESLERMPKVSITSPGKIVIVSVNGVPSSRLEPEIVRIKNRTWTLPAGQPVEVPLIVAETYARMKATEAEGEERKAALSLAGGGLGKSDVDLAQTMEAISRKYSTRTDSFPLATT